jgi:hypothetical protein
MNNHTCNRCGKPVRDLTENDRQTDELPILVHVQSGVTECDDLDPYHEDPSEFDGNGEER